MRARRGTVETRAHDIAVAVGLAPRRGSNGVGRAGRGARVTATLDVTPGQTLYAVVGGSASGTTPGFNGGGAAGGTVAECRRSPS